MREPGQAPAGEPDRSWISKSDGVLTLRPDPHRLKVYHRLAALPVAFVLSIGLIVRLGWAGVTIVAGTLGVCVAIALVVRQVRIARAFLRLSPMNVAARPWYGRARSVPRAKISRVALVTAMLGRTTGDYDVDYMVFLDSEGRSILSASCKGIPKPDQQGFAAALHVPIDTPGRPLGLREMLRQYPATLSWYWKHQYLVAIAIASGVAILVVATFVGIVALNGGFAGPGRVGQTRSLPGVAEVTVLAVDDPAQLEISNPSIVQPGTRLVGVLVRIHNTGYKTLDIPSATVQVMDSSGTWDYALGSARTPTGVPTNVTIQPDRTLTAYVLAAVPDGARVVKVEYTYTDSRGRQETLDWVVAATPAPAASSG